MDVDNVVSIPNQSANGPFRVIDLSFKRGATNEIVVEFDILFPAKFDRRSIKLANVRIFKAAVGLLIDFASILAECLRKFRSSAPNIAGM